ncbi:MAG: sugar O-acetyltransferase [Crocinitomicaceae bacterium]
MDSAKLIKRLLFAGVLLAMSIPMILTAYPFVEIDPLEGSFEEVEKPAFSWDSVYTGGYQKAMEAYINENTGGRPYLVRINNQLDFWLFNKANAAGVLIGKEGFLYEESYIDSYYGSDFVGDDVVHEKMRKLQRVADTLQERGTELVVVFAPGKGSFYPEYFPGHLRQKQKRTNYLAYLEAIEKTDVHFMDFRAWFLAMKEDSKYPLFPKGGIHWSSYGEVLAADSMIQYMNSITKESQINRIKIDQVNPSKYAYNMDEDIEESMNLLFNLEDLEMGYPVFGPVEHSAARTTKVLTVADSYFWGMYNWGLATEYFNNGEYWYYNREMYPQSFTKLTFVQNLVDLTYEVEKNDVVMILFTDANLKDFAYDFIDRLYEEYCEDGRVKRERKIQKLMQDIRNTPDWLAKIEKQAKDEGISLEEALRKNAVYMMVQEEKKSLEK